MNDPSRPLARATTLAMVAVLLAACAGSSDTRDNIANQLEPASLGVLPDSPPPIVPPPTPPTLVPSSVFAPAEVAAVTGLVGEAVDGNRLLLIGDTSMATLTERQGGIACPAVPDFGWQLRIEAEVGRFITFADRVIDEAVVDVGVPWDAYGLMFGLHVDTSPDEFGAAMGSVIDRLDGRPVLVYTVPDRADRDDVPDPVAVALNQEIRRLAARPNVVLVDWSGIVEGDSDGSLVDDDRVPTAEGMSRLTLFTIAALGQYPPLPPAPEAVTGTTQPPATVPPAEGACLEPTFTDDSAIIL